jgi:hypothetical protein
MALEYAAEDQRAHDVLVAADDRQEAVDARPAGGRELSRGGEDVERQRQVELDGGFPDRVIDLGVVVFERRDCPASSRRADPAP